MKILLATEHYWPIVDGGAVFEHNLALYLQKQGHQVVVIAPSMTHKPYVEHDHGTKIYRLPSLSLFHNHFYFSPWPYGRVKNIIKSEKPDVIHTHNPFFIGLAASHYGLKFHIPVVATNHNLPENITLPWNYRPYPKVFIDLNWAYFRWFYNRLSYVTSPTQTAVDILTRHGITTPRKPISNGIDTSRFKPHPNCPLRAKLGIPTNKPVVLYTGRLDGEKRMDIWVKSIPYILKQVDAHFVIGGKGVFKPELEKMIARMSLQQHVTFPGFIEEKDFPHIYHVGDVFAMSSPVELQSIVTLEALASGLPVVLARAVALPELVQEGTNGYTFTPQDPKDMAAKLISILKDPKLRAKMGQASREFVKRHDYHHAYAEYAALYQQVIKDYKRNK